MKWFVVSAAIALVAVSPSFAQTKVDALTQLKNLPQAMAPYVPVSSNYYNYAAIIPNLPLTGGVQATLSITCPPGFTATDPNEQIWISGGTGSSETVALQGGTCASSGTGTIIFTPANSHSGAWTIASPTNGIYETIKANPYRKIYVPKGHYIMHGCIEVDGNLGLYIYGDTYDNSVALSGTYLDYSNVTTCNGIDVSTNGTTNNPIIIQNMLLEGTNSSTGMSGIALNTDVRVYIDKVAVAAFANYGIWAPNSYEIYIANSEIVSNGLWGILQSGIANLIAIESNIVNNNCRQVATCGNIEINAASGSTTVQIEHNDISYAGTNPFGSPVTLAYGALIGATSSVVFRNNYVEGNLGNAIFYEGSTSAIDEAANWINGGSIAYGSSVTGVHSNTNTFRGSTSLRTYQATDLSSYVIGPDTYLLGAVAPTLPISGGSETLATVQFSPFGSQPTCAAIYRGTLWYGDGNGSTTSDGFQACVQGTTGSYAWQNVIINNALSQNLQLNGALGVTSGLTVSGGGAAITGSSTITGGLTIAGTGLAVTGGGFAVTGNSGITGQLTVSAAVNAPTFNGHLSQISYGTNGTGCTTAGTDGATCSTVVTWTTGFADTNYGVSCTIVGPTGSPHVQGLSSKATGSVTVILQNGSAAQAVASGGPVSCVGIEN